jgi:hypothetical protein
MIDQIFRDEREQKILHEAMERLDMSAEAVIRYWARMGQLVDHQIQQGYKLAWVKNGEVVDPFDMEPKAALVPPATLSCGCDVGTCICDYEKD